MPLLPRPLDRHSAGNPVRQRQLTAVNQRLRAPTTASETCSGVTAQGYPRWSPALDRYRPPDHAASVRVAGRPAPSDAPSRRDLALDRWSSRRAPGRGASRPHDLTGFSPYRRPPVRSTPHLSPRSSGDRAPPSGGGSVGSNPTGGAVLFRLLTWGYAPGAILGHVDDVGLRQRLWQQPIYRYPSFPTSDRVSSSMPSWLSRRPDRLPRGSGGPTFEVTPWLVRAASRASETSLSRLSKRCP